MCSQNGVVCAPHQVIPQSPAHCMEADVLQTCLHISTLDIQYSVIHTYTLSCTHCQYTMCSSRVEALFKSCLLRASNTNPIATVIMCRSDPSYPPASDLCSTLTPCTLYTPCIIQCTLSNRSARSYQFVSVTCPSMTEVDLSQWEITLQQSIFYHLLQVMCVCVCMGGGTLN